jgi:pyridoxal phosphate enzyme (YggS family)
LTTLAERLSGIDARIAAALEACGRTGDEITRIVVTKFHPAQLVRDLYALGVRDFGENRDQEAAPKAEELEELDCHWHFIGQLQSNKAKSVVRYADSVHSLDRQSLLESLAKVTEERANPLDVFIQMNLTQDENRGGISPGDLLRFAEAVAAVPTLRLRGVMAVASLEGQEERDFELVAEASDRLRAEHSDARFISAGMSGDFELALTYGATHLRIGTAITGNRA